MPDQGWFLKAVELIKSAKRPFIYAGGGVISSEASEELRAFAEKVDAPVSCSLMCQGGFDELNHRYVGMLGMHGTKTASCCIRDCDLLIAVGTRFFRPGHLRHRQFRPQLLDPPDRHRPRRV